MANTLDTFKTATMIAVLEAQQVPKTFFLDRFFTSQINFDSEKIVFDKVYTDHRKVAPFVAPNAHGEVLTSGGYETKEFKPAYVKPKHIIDNDDVFVRQPGEKLVTGSLTPEQRRKATVANRLREQRNMITARYEWMAAQAVIYGSVTVSGENYPSQTINFGRDASLSTNLTGGALWNETTATPLDDLRENRANVKTLSKGGVVRDYLFGADAWVAFASNPEVKALLDRQTRGSETEYNLVGDMLPDEVEFMGTIEGPGGAGRMNLFVVSTQYVDASDAEQLHLPADTVVGVAGGTLQGVRCFGAIKVRSAGFKAMEMYPKNWVEDGDLEIEYVTTQSAPLMVPKEPNASFRLKVL